MGLEVLVLLVLLLVMGALTAALWVVTIRHNRRSVMEEGLLPLAGPWEAAFMTLILAFLLLAVWGLLT